MSKEKSIFFCFCAFFFGAFDTYAQTAEITLIQAKQFYDQNNYPLAQANFFEAIKQADLENRPDIKARSSLALARSYYYINDRTAAFKWSYNALHTIQQNNLDSLLSQAYYFLGALYIEAENLDSVEKYSFKAIELLLKENNYAPLSQTYSTLAELHLNTSKNSAKIESMIGNAEKYAELSQDKGMMAFAASKRYNYAFFLKRDYEEALKHVNKEEELYLETENREGILNAYRAKAECLIMLRDTSARSYMLQWFAFKDSVLQSEKAVNIAKFETLFETEKKEQENKLLQQKNELNQLILLVIGAMFLSLIALGLWLYNRNNLKKKQQELLILKNHQRDKERIARDLHDNVGGQLSFIIYSLDGIVDDDKAKRIDVTDSINQSVRSVINSLRETIWAISETNISVHDFSDKLKVFVRKLFKHNDTQINFTENLKSKKELNALLGLNLYRICQEILNNAFKYAKASEVKIDIQCDDEKLLIVICDNGIGFDAAQTNKEQYGLQNIKKRASEFGVSLSLKSEIDQGTRYELSV